MDNKEQLEGIIENLDDNSISKILFSVLNGMNEIDNETIDKLISAIESIGDNISEQIQLEKMKNIREYLLNLKNIEIQERKREISSMFVHESYT